MNIPGKKKRLTSERIFHGVNEIKNIMKHGGTPEKEI